MKVIDLLNKIANGEEVPKKIQVYSDIFVFDDSNGVYEQEGTRTNLLSIYNGNILNYEVRIKKDKKIEKIGVNNYKWNYAYDRKTPQAVVDNLELIRQKINEMTDYINEENR